MAKRRRVGSGADDAWEQTSAQRLPFASFPSASDYASSNAEVQDVANPNSQWPASSSSAASAYPEVAGYPQQPYFLQRTDPSTYNSPWPPAQSSGSFVTQASNPSGQAVAGAMPYFPTSQNGIEVEQSGMASNSVQTLLQDYQPELDATTASQQQLYGQFSNGQQHSDRSASQSALYFDDASMHIKSQSLPILNNLATQLIYTIAKASFLQVQEIMAGNDTEDSQAYTTLKNLFDQTRKVYSRETPFIDAIAIQMFQPGQQEIIRKANIATFISSILGAHDVSFFHLNEYFMETFVPLGHRLLKWQGAMLLELKTQTYISALMNSDGSPEAMLDELFPTDLDAQIPTRHPDAPSLSPSEQDFIDRSRARKSYLLAEDNTEEALRELPRKYQWHDFVKEFASCINKNVDSIMNVPAKSQPVFGGSAAERRANAAQALNGPLSKGHGSTGAAGVASAQSLMGSQSGTGGRSGQRDGGDSSKKSSAAASTARQQWTKPEEDALLFGLERVNGPHWSQILALYGRGGSISEVLKDRNQVQLKDKARNLKLWYLKMGKDVPPALRAVTGELRKRGGARARAALGLRDEEEGDNVESDAMMNGAMMDAEFDGSGSKSRGSAKKKSKK